MLFVCGLLLTFLLGMLGYVHFLMTVAVITPRPSTFQGVHGVDGTGRLFYKSNEHTLFGYFKAAAWGGRVVGADVESSRLD